MISGISLPCLIEHHPLLCSLLIPDVFTVFSTQYNEIQQTLDRLPCVCIAAGTFTKSFGSAGGYIAGSKQLIAYLRRHCPAHLYATSMAPGVAQQIISAIQLLQGQDGTNRGAAKIKQLHDNANYFR